MTAMSDPADAPRAGRGRVNGVRVDWVRVVTAPFVVLAAGVGVGWVLRFIGGRGAVGPDRAITDWMVARRSTGLTDALRVLQPTGRGWLLLTLAAIGVALVMVRGHRRTGLFLVVAAIGSELLVEVTKAVVGRHRPPVALRLDTITNGAFPSGHAFNSTVVVGVVLVAVWHIRGHRLRSWVWVGAAFIPTIVGLTRVYLGVHWITDVIAGWVFGAWWVYLLACAFFPPVTPPAEVESRSREWQAPRS